ncbi:hypothetical protein Ccrd_023038, partial [Cynara cardunculus var. scolymus]
VERIYFNEHLKQLSGVPILFIPDNGGSYKQGNREGKTQGAAKERSSQGQLSGGTTLMARCVLLLLAFCRDSRKSRTVEKMSDGSAIAPVP